jgi:hypothetical protein
VAQDRAKEHQFAMGVLAHAATHCPRHHVSDEVDLIQIHPYLSCPVSCTLRLTRSDCLESDCA